MYSKISIYLSILLIILKTAFSVFLYNEIKNQFGESIHGDIQPSIVTGGDVRYVFLFMFISVLTSSIIGIVKKNKNRFPALILGISSFVFSLFPIGIILYVILHSNG
ncbi:MAG: hypothetical protein ACPGSD_12865 [Flavobacteriales bacterium]